MSVIRYSDVESVNMFPGVGRKTLATGDSIMLTEFTWEKGSRVQTHSHPNEQASYVVQGKLKIRIRGEESVIQKGDSYIVPPNVGHSQLALERTVTVDTFSPPREDYRALETS